MNPLAFYLLFFVLPMVVVAAVILIGGAYLLNALMRAEMADLAARRVENDRRAALPACRNRAGCRAGRLP